MNTTGACIMCKGNVICIVDIIWPDATKSVDRSNPTDTNTLSQRLLNVQSKLLHGVITAISTINGGNFLSFILENATRMRCCFKVDPPSATLGQLQSNMGSASRACCG